MPIAVQTDLKKRYNLGSDFGLKSKVGLTTGWLLEHVRGAIADQNWEDFVKSWNITEAKQSLLRAIAEKYNLGSRTDAFNALWKVEKDARDYAKSAYTDISNDIKTAYKHLARIAALKESSEDSVPTFKRIKNVTWDKIVVFSDLHMTAVAGLDYFKTANFALYREVLGKYFEGGFHLVENGDIEDCLIHDLSNSKAASWADQAKNARFPIEFADSKWQSFLKTRYDLRFKAQTAIFDAFGAYYDIVKTFVSKSRYARLTGNHDTYLDDGNEAVLQQALEKKIGAEVYDVLRVSRYYEPTRQNFVRYVVLHGHQFDPECCQHGVVPHARSLGEVNTESMSWAFQGPDRFFPLRDTLCWINDGKSYPNILARKDPLPYPGYAEVDFVAAGVFATKESATKAIKANFQAWAEEMLEHEIAWDYFKNAVAFEALLLEMWTGDEFLKMRHLNEQDLCTQYKFQFLGLGTGAPLPKLVIGHTHEPRQNAYDDSTGFYVDYYLNTGSAGRFENLIWCVEIEGTEDRICSWTLVNGQPVRTLWRGEDKELKQSG